MRFSSVALLASAASLASAANFTVLVGDGGALAFSPTSVTVASGDTINFEFRAKNHTATQSTFANPCTLQTTPATGVDSGFQFVAPGSTSFPTWSITVQNASAPLWFFCAQTNPASHCHAGMVFAVNPTAEKSFDAFQAAAKALGASTGTATTGGSTATTAAGGGGYGYGSPVTSTPASAGSGTPSSSSSSGALRMSGSAAAILLAGAGLFAGTVL
jgi:plastocyanin